MSFQENEADIAVKIMIIGLQNDPVNAAKKATAIIKKLMEDTYKRGWKDSRYHADTLHPKATPHDD